MKLGCLMFILDLESLEARRIKKALKIYYKLINGLISPDKKLSFMFLE